MNDQFFTLMSLGLHLATPHKGYAALCSQLDEKEWLRIKDLSDKQGVSSIVMDGVSLLGSSCGYDLLSQGVDKDWWKLFWLQWIGVTQLVEEKNSQQLAVMEEMTQKWAERNILTMVFKGQANGLMYPNPLHRTPGDIDCYLFGNYALGNKVARIIGAYVDEGWYKHSEINYKGELFENHQYFVHTREGKRSKQLQKELEKTLSGSAGKTMLGSNAITPPEQWNAMFLTYHACSHFLTEGLKLKQVLDWAMFLNKHQNEVDWTLFYDYCERFHLRRFSEALTAICVDHLGLRITNSKIVAKSEFAHRMLHSILEDDDYVYSRSASKWEEKKHLIRNLFNYRWKYEDIYQDSVWKQLWWYMSGYLFKTELFLA